MKPEQRYKGGAKDNKALKLMDFHIGQRIKTLREGKGLHMGILASGLGLHRLAYRRIELGERTLHLHEAYELAKVFGVKMEDFLPEEKR